MLPSPAQKFGLVAAWAGFCLFCVWGTPPLVDLPAHGAQLQLMRDWLAGDQATRHHFSLHAVPGYGLWYWLALPVATVLDGALAAKAVAFLSILLLPAALHFFLAQVGQQRWVTVLALPLCFSVSYWYGFLSTLVTLPALFLGLGLWERFRRAGAPADRWGTVACALFCALDHPVSWAALVAALLGAEAARGRRSPREVLRALWPLLLTGLVLAPYAWGWLQRAPTDASPPFAYRFDTHTMQWFWKNTRSESLLGLLLPLGVTALALVDRVRGRASSTVAFGAMAGVSALYAAMPYTGGGAMMLDIRLPVVVAALALGVLSSRAPRLLLCGLSLAALAEVGWAHQRFRDFVRPAEGLLVNAKSAHTTFNAEPRPPFSRHPFLEHFFAWETARFGGFADAIFADARHVPIQQRPEVPAPPASVVYGFGPERELPGCALEVRTAEAARWRCPAPDAGQF